MRTIETIDSFLTYIEKMTYDVTGWSCDIFMKLFFHYCNKLLEMSLCTKFQPNWSRNEENRDN